MINSRFFWTLALIAGVLNHAFAQTSVQNGDWQTGSTWNSGAGIRVTNVGDDNQDITVSTGDTVQVGAYGNYVGLTFSGNKEAYTLSINSTSVLIIYGDVEFANKSMNLNIDGTVVIFGNLTLNNKIDVSSSGTLVVTGTLSKAGSSNQGSYTGTGKVYAGAYDSGADDFIPGTTENGGDQQQTITNLGDDGEDDLVDFVDSSGEQPLPVTLQNFSFHVGKQSITLNWTTASEENFDHFEIQRADDRGQFETLDIVSGNGTIKTAINYTWTDEHPLPGTNYYRLVANDFDGFRETFKALFTSFRYEDRALSVFPNPASPNEKISIRGDFHKQVNIVIYNLDGRLEQSFTESNNFFTLPNDLKKGVYIVELSSNGITKRNRLIIR